MRVAKREQCQSALASHVDGGAAHSIENARSHVFASKLHLPVSQASNKSSHIVQGILFHSKVIQSFRIGVIVMDSFSLLETGTSRALQDADSHSTSSPRPISMWGEIFGKILHE